jgi:apolipoprotein N-acyltransferase
MLGGAALVLYNPMISTVIAALAGGSLFAAPFLSPALFPLAWISLVPLFWAIGRTQAPRRAFFFGWLTGLSANLIGFHWIPYTIAVFGGFSYGVSAIGFFIYAAYGGLAFAIFSVFVRKCGFGPFYLFPAIFWVAIEFWFPQLFPWRLANSQSSFLPFIQSADIVGPYGSSLIIAWGNAIIAGFLTETNSRTAGPRLAAVGFGTALLAVLSYGHLRTATVAGQMKKAPTLSVAAIQGNIDVGQKWDPDRWNDNLKVYRELSHAPGAALLIWPETAVEVWLPESAAHVPPEIVPPLSPERSFFIFGVRSFRGEPLTPTFRAFNSAFLADKSGRILDRYHKQALLAFGEYIPFVTLLSKLPGAPALGEGFSPGEGPETLDLSAGVRIAPLICYEDLMPDLARRFVAEKKANLLVNLTNDAWYGRSAAPWQHARLAQWRAIETRRSLVRATNTGVTTVINARGEILETLPIFSRGVLKKEVELLETETLYVRFGDWFAWGATLAALAILLVYSARGAPQSRSNSA